MAVEASHHPVGEPLVEMHGASIKLSGLTKAFGDTVAVEDLDLEIGSGEFFALLGPSGCGKTTTMRMIAGFEAPTRGEILIDGEDASGLRPADRNTGMVFQSYALFPHYDVFMNVAYGLIMDDFYGAGFKQKARALAALVSRRVAASDANIAQRVETALAQVALSGYQDRRVSQLSGGQQQRVALARALVKQPKVLLMDEPLSNLDKKLRVQTRATIREIQQRTGITTLFVTHDQEEAMGMADRVGVMRDGKIVQVGPPTDVYERPMDEWAADFVGESNLIDGQIVERTSDSAVIEVAGGRLVSNVEVEPSTDAGVSVLVRPENIRLQDRDADDTDENRIDGVVRTRAFLGASVQYTVDSDVGALLVENAFEGESTLMEENAHVAVVLPRGSVRLLAKKGDGG